MSVENVIIAAVMSKNVFRRFAKVSPEDKEKIVKKVKEKVNGNGKKKPAKKDEAPAEEEVKEEVVEETKGKKPKKGEVPPQLKKDKADDKAEDDKAEDDKAEDDKTEDDKAADDTEEAPGMEDIVGDLVEEVETIKSDGHIAPEEVLGLVDNMVKMVQSLLTAKPGRARNSAIGQRVREEVIAERVIEG